MELNKKNLQKIVFLIIFTVCLIWGLYNYKLIIQIMKSLFGLVFPFILGACIAFVLNAPMKIVEQWLRKAGKKKPNGFYQRKVCRPLSLVLSYILVVGVITLFFVLIIPEIGATFNEIILNIQKFFYSVSLDIEKMTDISNDWIKQISDLQIDWNEIWITAKNWLSEGAGTVLSSTIGVTTAAFSTILNLFLGTIFSIYILLQKEKLGIQFKKLFYAFMKKERADMLIDIISLSNHTFSNFLTGQCVEAVIIGFLFFIAMSIFRFPYAMIISVLIAFLALIPIFGAFIGCAIGMFLIVVVDPIKALWFLLLFLVLQQLEGNLIYPRVVGNSVGLPSIWVLVAVTIGGNTMGIVGMLIFIPLFSIFYTLLRRFVNRRLKEKKITLS